MIKLDLHGISHSNVSRTVEDFILDNQSNLPIYIIIGNSNTMRDLSTQILDKHNFKYFISTTNLGEIVVVK
jgi:hypothetical protein